jgi:hypothetical protein
MRPVRALIAGLFVLPIAFAGCSKSDSPTSNNSGATSSNCASKYSATVGTAAWCGIAPVANYYPNQQQVVFTAIGLTSAGAYSLTISVSSITAAGTYSLTSVSPLRFALAAFSPTSGASSSWSTANAGSTGSVTFTTFSTTHVVGTFTYNATANSSSTGTLAVTGSFDLVLTPAR